VATRVAIGMADVQIGTVEIFEVNSCDLPRCASFSVASPAAARWPSAQGRFGHLAES
jgi:hypothetical protein